MCTVTIDIYRSTNDTRVIPAVWPADYIDPLEKRRPDKSSDLPGTLILWLIHQDDSPRPTASVTRHERESTEGTGTWAQLSTRVCVRGRREAVDDKYSEGE